MSGSYSTINSYIAATVTLGQGAYLSPLSITGAGTIAPASYGAVALDAPVPGLILNAGTVAGAAGGAAQGQGATGAQGSYPGFFGNAAPQGGTGGTGGTGPAGISGGDGLALLAGGSVANLGVMIGGAGGAGGTGGTGGAGGRGGYDENNYAHGPQGNGGAGGQGGAGGTGGEGIAVLAGGVITNSGDISGGAGGMGGAGGQGGAGSTPGATGLTGSSGAGGIGVYLDGGTLINAGTISGGLSGGGTTSADAVRFGAGGGTLVLDPNAQLDGAIAGLGGGNTEILLAGAQTSAFYLGTVSGVSMVGFAAGAAGILAGSYANNGSGGSSFAGVTITGLGVADAIDINHFTLAGPEILVVGDTGEVTLTPAGGGALVLDFAAADDGVALELTAAAPGTASLGLFSPPTISSALFGALTLASALTVTQTGTVAPAYAGDTGVTMVADEPVLNAGTIAGATGVATSQRGATGAQGSYPGYFSNAAPQGGTGGPGGTGPAGTSGGDGLALLAGGSVSNLGVIIGGMGGTGGTGGTGGPGGPGGYDGNNYAHGPQGNGGTGGQGGAGGIGGEGLAVLAGGVITNSGEIFGGAGGIGGAGGQGGAGSTRGPMGPTGSGGAGGIGVYLDGGTLFNAGTISGGLTNGGTTFADAVSFGAGGGTLVLDANAQLDGAIAGLGGGNTEILLAGAQATAFDLGTVSGVSVIGFAAGASGILAGSYANNGSGGSDFAGVTITGFAGPDAVEISNFAISGPQQVSIGAGGALDLTDTSGGQLDLAFAPSLTGTELQLTNLAGGGTEISESFTSTFAYTGSIETYTIASSGIYDVTAEGAAGGGAAGNTGGAGAEVSEGIFLAQGDVIEVLVGGQGGGGAAKFYMHGRLYGYGGGGGGGGGTFLIDQTTGQLLAAGGGGGGAAAFGDNNINASTGTSGRNGQADAGGSYGFGGSHGDGGGGASYNYGGAAAGGAGYKSNGGNASGGYPPIPNGGNDPANGGAGGSGPYVASGGFGGGGGGVAGGGGGGGGGGYSGGGGGDHYSGAGGGGSYTNPAALNETGTAGVGTGNGLASLTEISVSASYASGASVIAAGAYVPAPVITAGGTVSLQAGATVSAPFIQGGTLELGAGSTVIGDISLSGAGRLVIDGSDPTNEIYGFAPGDSIELANVPYVQGDQVVVDDPGIVTIVTGGGDYEFNIAGAYVGETGLEIGGDLLLTTEDALCYLHGTRILTPTGPVPVESLRIGDTVITRFGGLRPIKWLGRQTYAPHFIAPEKFPVCVRAGALGENLPARDLYVSAGHSMLLGDILVLASTLINGATITQTRPESDVNYVQLDLGTHDCVVAEGSWSESYADAPGMRAQFHNAAEFEALYPNDPPPEDLTLCAPRPESGPRLESALRLLPETRKADERRATRGA